MLEQSGTQFFSLTNLIEVYKSGPANSIQILDIWWSSLGIMDDFKRISIPEWHFSVFGEININKHNHKSLF